VHATNAIVCAIQTGIAHTIQSEQKLNNPPKDAYLLRFQEQERRVNDPNCETTRRSTQGADDDNYSEPTIRDAHTVNNHFTTVHCYSPHLDSCATWGRTIDTVAL
jgi:hypothetical protein